MRLASVPLLVTGHMFAHACGQASTHACVKLPLSGTVTNVGVSCIIKVAFSELCCTSIYTLCTIKMPHTAEHLFLRATNFMNGLKQSLRKLFS